MVEVTFSYTGRILADGAGVIEERSNLTDRIVETRINARDEAITRVLEDTRQGEYIPDSFTTQPARIALAAHRKQGKAVGRVKTVGGYPDESEHTVEWLCKHRDLKDGDLLYATPQPAEQQPDVSALVEALETIRGWLLCAPIATAEDMAQSFPVMLEVVSDALAVNREAGGDA